MNLKGGTVEWCFGGQTCISRDGILQFIYKRTRMPQQKDPPCRQGFPRHMAKLILNDDDTPCIHGRNIYRRFEGRAFNPVRRSYLLPLGPVLPPFHRHYPYFRVVSPRCARAFRPPSAETPPYGRSWGIARHTFRCAGNF